MNSKDIYIKIANKLTKQPGVMFDNQLSQITIEEIEEALIDYTNEKIFEKNISGDYVEDLGVMFDKLDEVFLNEKEQNDFFDNYIFVMINLISNITGKVMFWTPEAKKEQAYPMVSTEGSISYFKTEEKTSSKENALWLFSYMKKELKPKKQKNTKY